MQSVADKLFASAQYERARSRDQELLRYVGRHGIVSIAHVMEAMGVGRTAAYRRVATCAEAGLLERIEVLRSEPTLLRATRDGLAYAGLPFPVAEISPATVTHSLRCVSAAQVLCDVHGPEHVLTEREIVYAERIEDRPLASATVGFLPSGASRLHRPDLAILKDGEVVSIEIELTAKSPRRLAKIMRAWRVADWVGKVVYACPPGGTRRAVKRAIKVAAAQGKVGVVEEVPW